MNCSKCGVEYESPNTYCGSYCRVCRNEYHRQYYKKLKLEALNRYGGAICKCCGETEICFLSLDHVKNDGASNRIDSGRHFYRWLQKKNWPDLALRVLCHNCNHGRFINGGVCPHEQKKSAC